MKLNLLRIRLISLGVLLFAVTFGVRLYLIQVVDSTFYKDRAEHQYVRPSQNVFDRGMIYFQNKDGTLYGAGSTKAGYTITLNPNKLSDAETESAYSKISKIIPIEKASFVARAQKNDHYEEIFKRVDESKAKQIEALKIPGIALSKDRWRFYPGGKLAGQVLGLVGYKGDTLAGRYGLESFYEDTLRRNTDAVYVNFFAEVFSNINTVINGNEDLEGDIISTIEPTVELTLEQTINDIQNTWSSEQTGGIIMDPKTGEIYAMAATPSFDPNTFQGEKSIRDFGNPLVENVYELGSIMKPLTIAAAIDAGAITAKTTYVDKGFVTIEQAKISNADHKPNGLIDMQVVLNKSLNTGAVYAEQAMGKTKFRDYMLKYGIGEETGIDLPNEAKGLVDTLNSPREVEYATASFGQGIAVTPIAMIRALSALGNGGVLPNPHVVKSINYSIGISKNISYPEGRQVISKASSEEISRMLTVVVDTALKNGQYKIPQYSIAAKTGTAQMSQGGGKGYYEDRYLHSFFGYFPAYNPRFIVFLYTVYPKTPKYAADTLTPGFFNIAKFLLHYYEITPDR